MVKWNPDVQTKRVSSPEIGTLEWTPKWIRTGDHSQEGILLIDSKEQYRLSHLEAPNHFLSPMVFAKIVTELLEPKMAVR